MGGSGSSMAALFRACRACGGSYWWERSSAGLRLSYCSWSCERAALGITIEALLGAWLHVPSSWRYLLSA